MAERPIGSPPQCRMNGAMSDDAHRNPEKVTRERHVLGRGWKAGGEKASGEKASGEKASAAADAARQAVEYLTQAAKSGAQRSRSRRTSYSRRWCCSWLKPYQNPDLRRQRRSFSAWRGHSRGDDCLQNVLKRSHPSGGPQHTLGGMLMPDIRWRYTGNARLTHSTHTRNLTMHLIDPHADEARGYLVQDLLFSERISRVGYVHGSPPLPSPRRTGPSRETPTSPMVCGLY